MNIEILNQQESLKIYPEAVPLIVKEVLDEEKIYCDELSITFLNKKDISKLHLDFFNDPTPTDCISFPMDDPKEKSPYIVLGEVFVCTDVAIEYALEHNLSPYDELTLYIIHGLLHLIGYDDIDEEDRKEMRLAEERHLARLRKNGIKFITTC